MRKKLLAAMALGLAGVGQAHAQSGMDIVRGRMELNLRQAGLTPEAAQWATWASEHKPYTACAQYADRIDGMMNMPDAGDPSGYIPYTVIKIEQSGICRRAVVEKAKPSRQYLEEQRKLQKQRDELLSHSHTVTLSSGPTDCLKVDLQSYVEDEQSSAHVKIKCHLSKRNDGYLHTEQCSVIENTGDDAFPKDALEYSRDKCWSEKHPPALMSPDGTTLLNLDYTMVDQNN